MALVAFPQGAAPLAVGTILALGALSYVLWPLLGHDASRDVAPPPVADPPSPNGRSNVAYCPACGVPVAERGSRFCVGCGERLPAD
jgi:hypothetical protein